MILDDILRIANDCVYQIDHISKTVKRQLKNRLCVNGKINAALLDQYQNKAHGLAWLETYNQALKQLNDWAHRLDEQGRFGQMERLILAIGMGEYCAQILGGIAMNQGEYIRLHGLGLDIQTITAFGADEAIEMVITHGNSVENRAELAKLLTQDHAHRFGDAGLDDTLNAFQNEMERFARTHIHPFAHEWHLNNAYIPLELIQHMAELGVFGLTIPENYGGLGMGKQAMCVVSEELSRAYIGVGSLGTRSEIAAELILCGGTPEQKEQWLPRIASGEVLPTAVFTEPDTGSDLASLTTRAELREKAWHVFGNKTWITHPVRADLMTLLVRTNSAEKSYKGLSMLLAAKPRGNDDNPFPSPGLTGSEIEVLGYRGMKEYELSFDGFQVDENQLLGGVPGQGFKQLMQTFESARIQTAARAVGVAQSALDQGLLYAQERKQFGKAIIAFPRIADKIVMMVVETQIARQLTLFAARQKDGGNRCDVEAGMAKLLAARIAWANADNALQIHGGNGFALEYPISRILCDARILNIFEGAAEIQAQVIARRLLEEEQ